MLDKRGQTTVEYIILLAAIMLIVSSIFNSDAFRGIVGEQGLLGQGYKKSFEKSYRFATSRAQDYGTNYSDNRHPSYNDLRERSTRFFFGLTPYEE